MATMPYLKALCSFVRKGMGMGMRTGSYEPIQDEEKGGGGGGAAAAAAGGGATLASSERNQVEVEVELAKHQSSNAKQRFVDIHAKNAYASQKQRLVSLDVFRGLTVALMILVDDAGGLLPSINHSPWNGVTLADFVMPFFLFIVGVSLALVYKKVSNRVLATQKAFLKFLKLLLLGIILQGGYFHGINDLSYGINIEDIRWLGVLQRIAFGYLLAAFCEIWLTTDRTMSSPSSLFKKYYLQLLVALMLTILYMGFLYGTYVPDWQYEVPIKSDSSSPLKLGSEIFSVRCGVRGDVGPACNAVGMIDRNLLGLRHMYKRPIYMRTKECSINSPDYGPLPPHAPSWCQAPFDPEGILSSVMAVVACFVGLHFGHIIVHFKGHRERMRQWFIMSVGLILFGMFLDAMGMHLNKALYSVSYMLVTSGASGLVFVAMYLFVDIYQYRRPTILLEWIGMNALVIYVLAACNLFPIAIQGFYWKYPENNILSFLGGIRT